MSGSIWYCAYGVRNCPVCLRSWVHLEDAKEAHRGS